MSLLVKAMPTGEAIVKVTPETARWHHVGFEARRIEAGSTVEIALPADREGCLVVLVGRVDIAVAGHAWEDLGGRDSVFDDRSPHAVYAPPSSVYTITARTDAELALASAPATGKFAARLIEPSSMKRFARGQGLNTRYVCDILPQTEPADRLLVVEVVTPSGHSSSYPPHKHDTDNAPVESSLEETYYHRLNPAQGFAFQRVYTDDRSLDESLAVEDHDVVMVPRGYHPVVVPYGYDSYYLNVMAGPVREWHFKNDPVHEWMLKQ